MDLFMDVMSDAPVLSFSRRLQLLMFLSTISLVRFSEGTKSTNFLKVQAPQGFYICSIIELALLGLYRKGGLKCQYTNNDFDCKRRSLIVKPGCYQVFQ